MYRLGRCARMSVTRSTLLQSASSRQFRYTTQQNRAMAFTVKRTPVVATRASRRPAVVQASLAKQIGVTAASIALSAGAKCAHRVVGNPRRGADAIAHYRPTASSVATDPLIAGLAVAPAFAGVSLVGVKDGAVVGAPRE